MIAAYACPISRENLRAIASEKPNFDMVEFLRWMTEHDGGYFIRDEKSPWDCEYMDEIAFAEIYIFDAHDSHELFRRIVKR